MKSKRMHILLTNDDGIYADGIYAIYRELIKFADVTVVALNQNKALLSRHYFIPSSLCQKGSS